jgi:hypothetical protein
MSRFNLLDCERPSAEAAQLVIGVPMAVRPEWCELSAEERLAEAEAAYGAGLEVDVPDGDAGPMEQAS